ncbi:Fatty acyl-coenzyme A reductase, NAD-binding domain [Dillenia turbinata]|uniref:Fatty acyl-CoA reductase n=1 Tax=Dillenia turbinata TaxID=194707 RepID=A0AAN8W0Z8_9MAGN
MVTGFRSRTTLNPNPKNGIGILQFLQAKNYFITGATGFLGKVLVEKLLRTVPNVGKIFVLIQAKDQEAALRRLKSEIINSELFKCIKQIQGSSYEDFMLSRLVPVVGNICEPNLGMHNDVALEIAREVDQPILRLMRAYVNGKRQGNVMEKPLYEGETIAKEKCLYSKNSVPSNLDVDAEIRICSTSKFVSEDNEQTQAMKEMGIKRAKLYGWQNTYEFTKAMGEMIINSEREDVPLVILRPSIIQSTFQDPFPGWIEGNRMADPLILNYGRGLLPAFVGNAKTVIDVIPVDMVVNALIAAIAKHGIARKPGIKVYHVASSLVNPLEVGDMFNYSSEYFDSSPMVDLNGRRKRGIEKMKFISSVEEFSKYIWAETSQEMGLNGDNNILDAKGFERLQIKCRKRVNHALHLAKIYEPYMFYGAWFDNGNIQKLMEEMSEEERQSFNFDVECVVWKHYITKIHVRGLEKQVKKQRDA